MKEVRTRFAPSPTGLLHVGSVRTTIFAWLLARHCGGKFLLRIEDTDQERLVPGAIREILADIAWFGMDIDEGPSRAELEKLGESWDGAPDLGGGCGPYIQSLRLPRYKEVAEELIAKGVAYRCDCTAEMLERERNEQMARKELPGYSGYCRDRKVSADTKHVVRFRMPTKRSLQLADAVKGLVTWDSISLRDMVLLKSDGFPTYHLAVVADDHDMRISHVMRGEEWLATAPLHILLYEALGWEMPVFAHLPSVMGNDGKKLSKRHGATFVKAFRDEGYLPEALLNFLTLIGWSPGEGEEQEIFSIDELIKRFSLERVHGAGGIFDYGKLSWMNGMYIKNLPDEEFIKRATPFIEKAGLSINLDRFRAIAGPVKERVKLLTEVPSMIEFLFVDKIERDIPAMYQKGIDAAKAKEILLAVQSKLQTVSDFSHATLEAALRPLEQQFGIKLGPLFGVIRIAVTGKKITPPLFESLAALGREETMKRIGETLDILGQASVAA
ncbi:MAG: glutamate--tRNA ligase [Deltaproteobacteria bacterium]|nr:glutamate--tRNA ligase [Deltaproteobacteria bacterium]